MGNIHDTAALREFCNRIASPAFYESWQGRVYYDVHQYRDIINNYIEETFFGLRLLQRYDLTGKRILEIGSGTGFLTAWLLVNGYDIKGIEPSAVGYHFHYDVIQVLWDMLGLPPGRIFDLKAEEVSLQNVGEADFIFSINVMEHVEPQMLDTAVGAMLSVLAPGGAMLHHCPNYFIPYEPHYGFALIPFFYAATGKIKGVSNDGVWKSLNFITYFKVKKIARRQGLKVSFERGIMADAFKRFEHDAEYVRRHPALSKIYRIIKAIGIVRLMELLPAWLCTPMTFEVFD